MKFSEREGNKGVEEVSFFLFFVVKDFLSFFLSQETYPSCASPWSLPDTSPISSSCTR